jgi:hypothetical protein
LPDVGVADIGVSDVAVAEVEVEVAVEVVVADVEDDDVDDADVDDDDDDDALAARPLSRALDATFPTVRMEVHHAHRRQAGGTHVGLPATRAVHGRELLSFQEPVQVGKRLLQSLPQVSKLCDAFFSVGQELVDPLADEGTADAVGPAASDLVGVLVREHIANI